jgi:hypothetical protein
VPQFFLRVSQGSHSEGPDHVFECDDQNTAWAEMTKVCCDFIGSACRKLELNSGWSMELLDADKRCTGRISLVAEKVG